MTATAPPVLVVGGGGGGHALAGRLKRRRDVRCCQEFELPRIEDRVDLIGIGTGGTAAIAYAAAHPERVRRLVVVGGAWPDGLGAGPRPQRSLVLWGAADRRLRPRVGEQVMSALGRSAGPASVEMVTLPGVGHGVLEAAGERVAGVLDEFLR